jgi:hypothetical protein
MVTSLLHEIIIKIKTCYNKIVHVLNVLLIRIHKNNATEYTNTE